MMPLTLASLEDDIVNDQTEFGLNLYKQVAKTSQNLFISPYSISAALTMTMRGAAGETKSEVSSCIYVDLYLQYYSVIIANAFKINTIFHQEYFCKTATR